jgi:muramoyltetrapeptide carboxypeptidase
LNLGDTVGLIAPASSDDEPLHLENAQATVRGMGLVPKTGRHVSDIWGYFSGTDHDRAADIHAMFTDESVRAIFAVRGGWGSARLLPLLDWDLIRAHPKLLIGSSDVTAASGHCRAHGLCFHPWAQCRQPLAGDQLEQPVASGLHRRDAVAGRRRGSCAGSLAHHNPSSRQGAGRLLGGNLTVLTTLMGTPWLPDFDGAILFIEDVGEAEYRIDRMLSQLALSGVLDRLAG